MKCPFHQFILYNDITMYDAKHKNFVRTFPWQSRDRRPKQLSKGLRLFVYRGIRYFTNSFRRKCAQSIEPSAWPVS